MGAMFFVLILAAVFVLGIIWLSAGIVFYLMREKKNCFKGLGIGLCILGSVTMAIPVGWYLFIRINNSILEEDYVNTGVMLEWQSDGEEGLEYFVYEDKRYTALVMKENKFYYQVEEEVEREAVFNIQYPLTFFEKVWVGKTASTMYHLENGAGMKMFTDGYTIYCLEDELEKAQAYYKNDDNYKWYLETGYYNEDKDPAYSSVEKEISLTKEEISAINNLKVTDADTSLKYEEDAKEYNLLKKSKDGVVSGRASLMYDKGVWYWDTDVADVEAETAETWYNFACELPGTVIEKLNKL